ncbi:hypothetical protein F5Y13DRAFT_189120 [Hypoxylon sp. FL1857]|nr:hypothetical protein F5Y13DRAFT_189120 [Hypoxylon sp. FL1857]
MPPKQPYRHYGVYIPWENVEDQWTEDSDINERGFIFINRLKTSKVMTVQSVGRGRRRGELLVKKMLRYNTDTDRDMPEELMISTAPAARVRLPRPRSVHGVERLYFAELYCWQYHKEHETHSLYYNGGTLEDFMEKYEEIRRPVPEHFIWLVALRLAEIVRYMSFGIPPGTDDNPPLAWELIAHRDVAPNNIFLHYHDPSTTREPAVGFVRNAFPEVILGDFGEVAMESDEPDLMRGGILDWGEVNDWEDIYFMGEILRRLAQTHLDHDLLDDVNGTLSNTVNDSLPANETPYSDDLIRMLEEFEYTGMDSARIYHSYENENGHEVQNWEDIPDPDRIANVIVPLARRKVRRYLGIGELPHGYYRSLDVSWTRPNAPMPYRHELETPNDNNTVQNDNQNGSPPKESSPKESSVLEESSPKKSSVPEGSSPEESSAPEGSSPEESSAPKESPPRPAPPSDVYRRQLGAVTAWSHVQPEHQIRTLKYNAPILYHVANTPPPGPIPAPPPGGDSDTEYIEVSSSSGIYSE